jgi:hypothetical protein
MALSRDKRVSGMLEQAAAERGIVNGQSNVIHV